MADDSLPPVRWTNAEVDTITWLLHAMAELEAAAAHPAGSDLPPHQEDHPDA